MADERRVRIHIDREDDGRFIAEIDGPPSILAYGSTEREAALKAAKLYLGALPQDT
jgi:predicted RNase H-like HicB family nuclease